MARLAQGIWKPGATLPTEADLARTYGCARATVNRAMRELAEEGFLDRRRKTGTQVRLAPVRQARFDIPLIRREIEAGGAGYGYALIARTDGPAPGWLAERLGLSPGAPVLHLVCLHRAGGAAFQVEDRWINLDTLPAARTADFSQTGPNEWLVATIPFSDVEIGFSAVPAGAPEAGLLGCAPGTPLFQTDRTTWLNGQPVTFVRLMHRPGYRMTTRY